ncbi:hypothetical protein ACQP2U_31830 [Nocardia sp. CA-084685]|uniref:hypothetical protein n=1 Tax=Nocardia sp. CA-084685 TaxID=3239970 RepID=UPI003D982F64
MSAVPDWTYHPLRPMANALLGERRAQLLALRLLAGVIALPGGGRAIERVFDHPQLPAEWAERFGARVPVEVARDAIRVLPVQGAGIVEVGPVGRDDIAAVRAAALDRRCRVIALVDDPEVGEALESHVDQVIVGEPVDRHYLTELDTAAAVTALADPAAIVLATPGVLIAAGPSWFNRVIEAAQSTAPPPPTLRDVPLDPRRWPAWCWGLLVGIGLIVAGIGAAAITSGPILLWYDRDYLGTDVGGRIHRRRCHLDRRTHLRLRTDGSGVHAYRCRHAGSG